MRTVQADGTITKTGGQVVKNVSGYDMARMHIGALGTLGVIAEVSFKLTPLPPGRRPSWQTFDSDESCLDAALAVFRSSLVPLAFRHCMDSSQVQEDVAQVKHDPPSWSESEDGREAFGGRPTTLHRSSVAPAPSPMR